MNAGALHLRAKAVHYYELAELTLNERLKDIIREEAWRLLERAHELDQRDGRSAPSEAGARAAQRQCLRATA
jgi:hypothetical protein